MIVRWKSALERRAFILVISMALTPGCQKRVSDASQKLSGEPEQYSATVVRIVEGAVNSGTTITREARAGELRREEWTENGSSRALIWRPDAGKAFLLDLDKRVYVQIDIGAAALPGPRVNEVDPHLSGRRPRNVEATDRSIQAVDQYFDDAQLPTRVETQDLSPATIDGHFCDVNQQKATFPDGHTETTTRFYARDLSGLLLRVEIEGEEPRTRVITERRDVRIGVAAETFDLPPGYRRVDMLPH